MSTISADAGIMTLINTFFVDPANADRLVAVLAEATERGMRQRPGFISANLHKSEDGTRVVNYAQWRSKEDFQAMLQDPEAAPHMKAAADLAARFEPIIYTVEWAG